jgi:methionyl-tRNA synthetase
LPTIRRELRFRESPIARSQRLGFVLCDHEYLNFKGTRLSKSRGAAVDVPYYLSKYDPDALRFYLTATAPETRDTEACPEGLEGFSWEDFVERNNNELVATARLSVRPSSRRGLAPKPGATWQIAC